MGVPTELPGLAPENGVDMELGLEPRSLSSSLGSTETSDSSDDASLAGAGGATRAVGTTAAAVSFLSAEVGGVGDGFSAVVLATIDVS